VVDISAARIRVASVMIGVWLTFVICAGGGIYVALTWHHVARGELTALLAAGALGGMVVSRLPWEQIVRSRWCETFFLLWSGFDFLLITVLVLADGGTDSPLVAIFLVPTVFAAMSYPLPSTIAVGVLSIVCYVTISIVMGTAAPSSEAWFSFALACTAVMSAWQARNHGRQHRLLARISRADPLTGALNRRGLEERVDAELRACERAGNSGALLLIDLDSFKLVNDRFGHAAGDELLCWVVQTLQRIVRPLDTIARLGGDEFAVLLPNIEASDALNCATRIRAALRERTGASIGLATYPLDGVDSESLLKLADARLYASRPARRYPALLAERLSWAEALARAVDSRMGGGHEHSRLVSVYAGMIATELGWEEEPLGLLRIAATLHDIGKFEIPDRILCKPGLLTEEEFAVVHKHPAIGAEMVSRIDGLDEIVPWIRHAHERFDGAGYPDGLQAETIPEAARIIFVADAFDAMTSDRPYRSAMSAADALAELRRNVWTQFDPRAVDALHRQLSAPGVKAQTPLAVAAG
jgi:diguanylate cyclase (GGDEF)-like protein/putative nucleotidyltransferase with HDIG domain